MENKFEVTLKNLNVNKENVFISYGFGGESHERFTLCAIIYDKMLSFGLSICSNRDNFSKNIGRTIALKRATQKTWTIPLTQRNDIRGIRKIMNSQCFLVSDQLHIFKKMISKT